MPGCQAYCLATRYKRLFAQRNLGILYQSKNHRFVGAWNALNEEDKACLQDIKEEYVETAPCLQQCIDEHFAFFLRAFLTPKDFYGCAKPSSCSLCINEHFTLDAMIKRLNEFVSLLKIPEISITRLPWYRNFDLTQLFCGFITAFEILHCTYKFYQRASIHHEQLTCNDTMITLPSNGQYGRYVTKLEWLWMLQEFQTKYVNTPNSKEQKETLSKEIKLEEHRIKSILNSEHPFCIASMEQKTKDTRGDVEQRTENEIDIEQPRTEQNNPQLFVDPEQRMEHGKQQDNQQSFVDAVQRTENENITTEVDAVQRTENENITTEQKTEHGKQQDNPRAAEQRMENESTTEQKTKHEVGSAQKQNTPSVQQDNSSMMACMDFQKPCHSREDLFEDSQIPLLQSSPFSAHDFMLLRESIAQNTTKTQQTSNILTYGLTPFVHVALPRKRKHSLYCIYFEYDTVLLKYVKVQLCNYYDDIKNDALRALITFELRRSKIK